MRMSSGLPGREPRFTRRFRDLRTVPVLPSLVTLGNLFFGFLAMSKCVDALVVQGDRVVLVKPAAMLFETAAILLFVAMVFDALDGAVARLTNQTSRFGAQLDSLADVVTFGVAPAFIVKALVDYHARPAVGVLPVHPKMYWAAAAIYVLCAAMRLARYNVEAVEDDDHETTEFVGLPTPAAAAAVGALVAFFVTHDHQLFGSMLSQHASDAVIKSLPPMLVVIGLLMVSRFPYPHLVAALIRGRHSFPFLATAVVLGVACFIEPQLVAVALVGCYLLWGILLGLARFVVRGSMDRPLRRPPPDTPARDHDLVQSSRN